MRQARSLLIALTIGAGALHGLGQESRAWRLYGNADGLPEAACRFVTIGAAGNVYVQGLHSRLAASFDGYTWTTASSAPIPTDASGGICESPGGQLWTVTSRGLAEWVDGAWRERLLGVIAQQRRAAPDFRIFLFPVRQNLVIFLLPQALMEFCTDDSNHPTLRVLRRAEETRLGSFTGLTAAPDDGFWLSGERGLARIPGPKRTMTDQTVWREFDMPQALGLRQLSVPECSDDDTVTCVGQTGDATNRVIVRLNGEHWSVAPVKPAPLKFAWQGPHGELWAATADSLLRVEGGKLAVSDDVPPGSILDVAVGSRGMFWVATVDGLFFQGPESWRAATPPPGLFSPRPAELTAQNGDRWESSEVGVRWLHGQRWTTFPPNDPATPHNALAFVEMPDGKIWCATTEQIWVFAGQGWGTARGGMGRINAMIRSSDGSVWVASNDGLHRFVHGDWIDVGVDEGLSSAVVQDVRENASGTLWAETFRGADMQDPTADLDAPRTFILGPREHDMPQGGVLTIRFAGRDKWGLTPPQRLLYSWRLDDRDWSPFDAATSAAFMDLVPGRHYFQVRAMDRNGNIDTHPDRLEFAVVLPWYLESRSRWIAAAGCLAALFFAALAFKRHRDLLLSYAEVGKQVAERTAELELANQELLQSQKMRALGALAAGIAHDFNNILSIIKGSAQIIEQNLDNPRKIRARADRIKTVVDQGSAVVQALLGFSRNSDDSLQWCEINPVVENTIRLLGDRFLRETEVRFEAAAGLPPERASSGLIQQILLNFIFNAAESMAGRKEILITTGQSSELPPGVALSPARAGPCVWISVRDHGCGIPPETLPRIFEPFFTTKAFSTRRGTGLGLSVAYELAQKMGAGLAVESTPGQGSLFTLLLAATADPVPAATVAALRETT